MTPQVLKQLEDNLWRSADALRANSDLKSTEYSTPVLGLIFLKFADNRYGRNEAAIMKAYAKLKGTRREKPVSEIAIEKCGFYLPDHARYDHLLNLPEEEDIAKAIKKAMEAIEEYKPELKGVLPQEEYFRLSRTDRSLPMSLLKNFADIPRRLRPAAQRSGNSPRPKARTGSNTRAVKLRCANPLKKQCCNFAQSGSETGRPLPATRFIYIVLNAATLVHIGMAIDTQPPIWIMPLRSIDLPHLKPQRKNHEKSILFDAVTWIPIVWMCYFAADAR